jgi:hypothetical protein
MREHRAILSSTAVGVALLALGATTGSMPAGASSAPSSPGFGTPTISGIQGWGFEQGLAIDPQDGSRIYTTAPDSATSGQSFIWRSTDGGQTFKWIPAASPLNGRPPSCVGGGDSEVTVDSAHHLYFADLTLANLSVARSDDGGSTFAAVPNCAGVPDLGVDRQWYATQGDPTNGGSLFLTYDRAAQAIPAGICPSSTPPLNNVLVLARSPALGEPGATAGINFSPSQVLSCDEGIMGDDVFFDYADTGPRVFVIHDDAAYGKISVVRCDVVAITPTNLTGLQNCVDNVISDFTGAGVTGANFPTLSVDDHGGLFAVWERAPGTLTLGTPSNTPHITGNTLLYYSFSSDEGSTWSSPVQLPTPGLNQAVFAWPGSGDPGRVDVAFYGAPEAWASGDAAGPDSVNGHYGLYVVQTLDGGTTWSPPVLASEHFIHRGSMFTNTGGQTGSRALGDFLKLRIGPQGQAEISYADSNNDDGSAGVSAAMFVQQISGPSVFGAANGTGSVTGTAPSSSGCVSDPSGDATFDAGGSVSPDQPNLDLTGVCLSQPDANDYQVTMHVADLSSLATTDAAEGTTLIWQTQWLDPSATDATNGGAMFMVYMESVNGAAPTCWVGQSAIEANGGNVVLTYPGSTQLAGASCSYTATAPGTITITVPFAALAAVNPDFNPGTTQFSITGSTQAVTGNAETPPNLGGIGGTLFNLIDVAPAFDFAGAAPVSTPEAPWLPLLILGGAGASVLALRRRGRRISKTR